MMQHKIVFGSGYETRPEVKSNLIDSITNLHSALWLWTDHNIDSTVLDELNKLAEDKGITINIKKLSNQNNCDSSSDKDNENVSIESLMDGLDQDSEMISKVTNFLMPHKDIFVNHATRSDILRFLILFKYGGLYVDTDEIVGEDDLKKIKKAVKGGVSATIDNCDVMYVGCRRNDAMRRVNQAAMRKLLVVGYDTFKRTSPLADDEFKWGINRSSRTQFAIDIGPGSLLVNELNEKIGRFEWNHKCAGSWRESSVARIVSKRQTIPKEEARQSLQDTFAQMTLIGHIPYNLYKFIYMLMVVSKPSFTYMEANQVVTSAVVSVDVSPIKVREALSEINVRKVLSDREVYSSCKYCNLILTDNKITVELEVRRQLESIASELNNRIVDRVCYAYSGLESLLSSATLYNYQYILQTIPQHKVKINYILAKALKHAKKISSADIIHEIGVVATNYLAEYLEPTSLLLTVDESIWRDLLARENSWLKDQLHKKLSLTLTQQKTK